MDSVIIYLTFSGAVGLIQFYGTFKIHNHDSVKIDWAMGLIEVVFVTLSMWELLNYELQEDALSTKDLLNSLMVK